MSASGFRNQPDGFRGVLPVSERSEPLSRMPRFQFGSVVVTLVFSLLACGSEPTPSILSVGGEEGSSRNADGGSGADVGVGTDVQVHPDQFDDLVPIDGLCVAECGSRKCGGDGCGGLCGECKPKQYCLEGECKAQVCAPGEKICDGDLVLKCNGQGSGFELKEDCGESGVSCKDGQCESCKADCKDLQCGPDGCGGDCGTCKDGHACEQGVCYPECLNAGCPLGKKCVPDGGGSGLCGGSLDFDHTLDGAPLGVDVNVEEKFAKAGVIIRTDNDQSVAATNPYKLNSASEKNSCASRSGWGDYWKDSLVIRFVYPAGNGEFIQAATHRVSLYVGQTWPGGIQVRAYAPTSPPWMSGSQPFHLVATNSNGTDFVEIESSEPIGYVLVTEGTDPDFTIDDLSFDTVFVP